MQAVACWSHVQSDNAPVGWSYSQYICPLCNGSGVAECDIYAHREAVLLLFTERSSRIIMMLLLVGVSCYAAVTVQ